MSKKMLGNIMREAQKLQAEMMRMQEESKNKTVEATAGGGIRRRVQVYAVHRRDPFVDHSDSLLSGVLVAAGGISSCRLRDHAFADPY